MFCCLNHARMHMKQNTCGVNAQRIFLGMDQSKVFVELLLPMLLGPFNSGLDV
jgi:hypothetical protein